MSTIQKFFKAKNPNSIEIAFLRQSKEDENAERQIESTDEKKILEDKIEVLEIEIRDLKKKYDGLKSKHVSLLQVLLRLEEKNQELQAKIKSEENANKAHEFEDDRTSKSEQSSDFLTHLVNLDFL